MNSLVKIDEQPAKLILNRRAIAAGLAALLGTPAIAVAKLAQLSNIPLSIDPADFDGRTMSGGLFLPDYRHPMVRIVFDDGSTTGWHRYNMLNVRKRSIKAIETCAPDKNGAPRYAQLAVG